MSKAHKTCKHLLSEMINDSGDHLSYGEKLALTIALKAVRRLSPWGFRDVIRQIKRNKNSLNALMLEQWNRRKGK